MTQIYADDLKLHLKFLKISKDSINMNSLIYSRPTKAYQSDAFPAGIGGFSNRGQAWECNIPKYLQFKVTLNFLEFIALTIEPQIDLIKRN